MRMIHANILVVAAVLWTPGAAAAEQVGIGVAVNITVNSLRSDRGQVLCALFASEDGFPTKPDRAVQRIKSVIEAGHATCSFADVASGTYAVSVTHDENSNDKLDYNFIGMPSEGVGASNNARGNESPPKFDAAAFACRSRATDITISVAYLI